MNVEALSIPDVLLIKPRVFTDDRGHFFEAWKESAYAAHGIGPFVQDNVSFSRKGVLRGLHFQNPHGQGKLVSALRGRIFDVAVDVRTGSSSFGKWVGAELSESNRCQLWIPPGFAHGFQVLSDQEVLVSYKCTEGYAPGAEHTIRWNDPDIAITWPETPLTIAPKDAGAPSLAQIARDRLPTYAAAR
jgi:dTDP-4-dehydrorhamnose 3,5-epimerase